MKRFIRATFGLIWLVIWATGAIVAASFQVARDIVKPSAALVPGVVIVPLHLTTATHLAVWVSLVNLTPGTLVVDIADSLDEAWVHSLYAADPEALRADLIALQDRVEKSFGVQPVGVTS
jgi:multicomponent Na+:H+ antiporter subunit E